MQPKMVCGYNVQQLVLVYKTRLHLLMGDLKEAKRHIKQLLSLDSRHPQASCTPTSSRLLSPTSCFLKPCTALSSLPVEVAPLLLSDWAAGGA